jgi:para-nitrobenzyl esterase
MAASNQTDARSPTAGAEGAVTRRRLIEASSVLVAAATTAVAASAQAQTPPAAPSSPPAGLGGGATGPIFHTVETRWGKVQGIDNAGVKEFKGIPYGGPTGGRGRFMPPTTPQPWVGVRECIGYREISPQTPADLRSDYAMLIMWDRHVGCGGMGEDMLSLNVWTPGVGDGAKRPVMVCFHGGGWATGSGNFPGYDGAQLARFGDVVVVTVNHRLSAFGYLNLVDLGAPSDFAAAGVCGVMDMVASLKWVRDNIALFGGDPARVMIFGQSGGGAKTSCLMGTPAAAGLFHRAAVQSGSMNRLQSREDGARHAKGLLDLLQIPAGAIADIQKVSWQDLLAAQVQLAGAGPGGPFSPVLDGHYLPHHPFDPVAPPESAQVPLIVSTTLEDAALALTNFDLDEAGLQRLLTARFGAKAGEILALYRGHYPTKAPFLIQAEIFTDAGFRRQAYRQVELKAAQGGAPAYMYLWAWPTPAFDGKFGAVHGIDVSASFHNYRDGTVDVGSRGGRVMCDRLAGAWVAFARTEVPDSPAIPHWPAYDLASRPTMVFNTDTRVESDPRGDIRRFWADQPPPAGPMG